MSYHSIEIMVEEDGHLSALHSENNQKSIPIPLAREENRIQLEEDEIVETFNVILKENRLRGDGEYKMLGWLLYKALLKNSIGKKIQDLREMRAVEKIKIELRFNGDDNRYAHWPWEYLYCQPNTYGGNGEYFLATEQKLILSRPVKASIEELQETIRILLVAPGPPSSGIEQLEKHQGIFGLALLAYRELFGKIRSILGTEELKNMIEIHELVATEEKSDDTGENVYVLMLDKFERVVKNVKPHIIHFFGHGRVEKGRGGGQVAFTDRNGHRNWVSDNVFAKAIESGNTRFVFLQACETAALAPYRAISGVARNLIDYNIPAVVAMQCKIDQKSAIIFTESFYKKLAENGIIEDAVQEGRYMVEKTPRREFGSDEDEKDFAFGIPVLYVKDRTPLFKLQKDKQEKDRPSTMDISIYCLCCRESSPIIAWHCPNGCGQFVDRPESNCRDQNCPQKILKWHKICAVCGKPNSQYEPKK